MNKHITYTVTPQEDGWPLEKVLREKLSLSAGQIRGVKFMPSGMLVNQQTFLRGRPVTTRFVMRSGDRIDLNFTDQGPSVLPAAGPLSILWESEDLLFVNKEAGLAVHPAHGHYTDTLVNRLAARYSEPGRLIGRLDKNTSGVLAVARNTLAATRLEHQRDEGILKRYYLALAAGTMTGTGLIDLPLLETSDGTPVGENGHALRLMKADPAGRSAATEYEVLEAHEDFSLLKIHLLTGRTHQIRAHLAALGHPLLGDELYQEFCGIRPALAAARTMLHSHEIRCLHPFTGEPLSITAPLPEDFRQLISQ